MAEPTTKGKVPTMQDVAEFLAATPNPDDDQFHAWAESKGYDTEQAEAVAYQLATVASKFVTGGKTGEKTVTTADVNGKQMQEGQKVEKEHTPDTGSAKKIAMDHLDEIPDYYTRLKKMEDQAKSQKQGAEDNFDWAMREAQKTHQAYAKGKRPAALSNPPAANAQERESDKRWEQLVNQGQNIHRQMRSRTKPVRPAPSRVATSTDPSERASDKRWDRLISESQALRKGRRA